MADKVPAIIKWLKSQDVLGYSPFTIDWVQNTIWECEEAVLKGTSSETINEAVKRKVENILQVLNPHLLDAGFFKQVLKQVS